MKCNTLVSNYCIIAGLIGNVSLFLVGRMGGKEV